MKNTEGTKDTNNFNLDHFPFGWCNGQYDLLDFDIIVMFFL